MLLTVVTCESLHLKEAEMKAKRDENSFTVLGFALDILYHLVVESNTSSMADLL